MSGVLHIEMAVFKYQAQQSHFVHLQCDHKEITSLIYMLYQDA